MTSLTEVYEGGNGAGLRRLYAGVSLFGVGAVLLVAGIVVAATEPYELLGLPHRYEARRVAGVLGGLGLPALFVGTMTVLPRADRLVRVGAVVGALVSVLGVVVFNAAYPVDWVGGSGDTSMTLVVAGLYFSGAIVTSWSLFASVANFKARNDPGGTVKLEITRGGETRVVEVSNDDLRGTLGGIGLLGGTPDDHVETQTNRPASSTGSSSTPARSRGGRSPGDRGGFGGSAGVTDGGASAAEQFSDPTDDAEFLDEPTRPVGDTYCGNCRHFRYARTDDGMVPYCGFHGEAMDDMDACEDWTPNT